MDRTTPPKGHVGKVTPTTHHNNTNNTKETSGSGGMSNSLGGGNRSHGYCLKWKYHPNNLLHMFNQLLLNESFTDVVVACEGRVIKCHKMVLSACSKYFEQVFCEYPQQNSTLVILKDYNYNDVQAIIEFMYQGEINVAHDRLQSLLKAAESLQVKGLADITGDGGGGSTAVNSTPGNHAKDETDFVGSGHSADDSNPSSPQGLDRKTEVGSSSIIPDPPVKKKRGRPPMTPHVDNSSMDGLINLSTHQHMLSDDHQFDDYPLTNMLETHYTSPRPSKKAKRKGTTASGSGQVELNLMDTHEEDGGSDEAEDDEVTEEDILSIVKMTEYIEKGGSRPQFWDEPLTKKVMNAIKNKKMEMKAAAEYLGVSYSTLYSRYRELYGYLKMPANQDTNFNYYQVLNLLRAGQISLQDAAKRLSVNERTLTAYLSTTITPKKPKTMKQGASTLTSSDSKAFGGVSLTEGINSNPEDMSLPGGLDEFDEDDSDSDEGKNLHGIKTEMDDGLWKSGR